MSHKNRQASASKANGKNAKKKKRRTTRNGFSR